MEAVVVVIQGQKGDRNMQAIRKKVASVAGVLISIRRETTKMAIRKVEDCMMILDSFTLLDPELPLPSINPLFIRTPSLRHYCCKQTQQIC